MTLRLTEEEYADLIARRSTAKCPPLQGRVPPQGAGEVVTPSPKSKPTKYRNRRVTVDGKRFDSQHEADVYQALMLQHRAGEIQLVLRQVAFDLPGNIRYIADFVIIGAGGELSVIDAKSPVTRKLRTYINKKKQLAAVWGIDIREV